MIEGLPLFDKQEGLRLKEAGMFQAASANMDWVEKARQVAEYLAAKHGETNIVEVYAHAGFPERRNAAGSIFKGKQWQCVGWVQNARKAAHAREIRRWSLR